MIDIWATIDFLLNSLIQVQQQWHIKMNNKKEWEKVTQKYEPEKETEKNTT